MNIERERLKIKMQDLKQKTKLDLNGKLQYTANREREV